MLPALSLSPFTCLPMPPLLPSLLPGARMHMSEINLYTPTHLLFPPSPSFSFLLPYANEIPEPSHTHARLRARSHAHVLSPLSVPRLIDLTNRPT